MSEQNLTISVTPKGIVIATSELTKLGVAAQGAGTKITAGSVATVKGFEAMVQSASTIKTIGRDLSRYVALPLAAMGAASIHFAGSFNESMANVQALIPGTGNRIYELKDAVMELSEETGKSLEDLSAGLYRTISVFQDDADTMDRLAVAARGAVAGFATTEESIGLVAAVTRAYGDTTSAAVQHAMDLAFATVRLGDTTFPALSTAMMTATDSAVVLGISQEELFNTFASLTGITGEASEVATQFRSAMASLRNPTDDLIEVFKTLDVTTGKDFIAQFDSFADALSYINDAAIAAEVPLQQYITRKEGVTLAGRLANEQEEEFITKLIAMSSVIGAQEIAFEGVTTGVDQYGFELDQAKRSLINASAAIGDDLLPALAIMITFLADAISGIKELDSTVIGIEASIAGLLVVIIPLITAFGSLLNLSRSLATFFPLIFTSASVALGGILLLVAGIAAALVIFGTWGKLYSQEKNQLQELQEIEQQRRESLEQNAQAYETIYENQQIYLKSMEDLVEVTEGLNSEDDLGIDIYRTLIGLHPELIRQGITLSSTMNDVADAFERIRLAKITDSVGDSITGINDALRFEREQAGTVLDALQAVSDFQNMYTPMDDQGNQILSNDRVPRDRLKEIELESLAQGALTTAGLQGYAADSQATVNSLNILKDSFGRVMDTSLEEAMEKIAIINEGIADTGKRWAYFEFEGVFKEVDIEGWVDGVNVAAVAADAASDAINRAASSTKTWREWLAEIGDFDISKMYSDSTLNDDGTTTYSGGLSGDVGVAAITARMERANENTSYINDILGLDNVESDLGIVDSNISEISDIMTQLNALQKPDTDGEFTRDTKTIAAATVKLEAYVAERERLIALEMANNFNADYAEENALIERRITLYGNQYTSMERINDQIDIQQDSLDSLIEDEELLAAVSAKAGKTEEEYLNTRLALLGLYTNTKEHLSNLESLSTFNSDYAEGNATIERRVELYGNQYSEYDRLTDLIEVQQDAVTSLEENHIVLALAANAANMSTQAFFAMTNAQLLIYKKQLEDLGKEWDDFMKEGIIDFFTEWASKSFETTERMDELGNSLESIFGDGELGKKINEIVTGLGMTEERAAMFGEAFGGLTNDLTIMTLSAIPDLLNDIGTSFVDSAAGSDAFKSSLLDLVNVIKGALPDLMIQAGLKMLPDPMGVGLIIAGGAGYILNGIVDAKIASAREGELASSESDTAVSDYTSAYAAINSAHGNILTQSTSTLASGGFINSPTRMGNAYAGESGNEVAIAPLRRTSTGSLGVESAPSNVNVTMTVTNNAADKVSVTTSKNSLGEIELLIDSRIKKGIVQGTYKREFKNAYGLKSAGVRS